MGSLLEAKVKKLLALPLFLLVACCKPPVAVPPKPKQPPVPVETFRSLPDDATMPEILRALLRDRQDFKRYITELERLLGFPVTFEEPNGGSDADIHP